MPGTFRAGGNYIYDWGIGPTLTPVAVAGSTAAEQSFTIPGLLPGDMVDVNCNSAQTAGISIGNVRVSAANTLTVEFANSTAGSLTPVSAQYFINIARPEVPAAALPTTAA
jgi:hypothetical protein